DAEDPTWKYPPAVNRTVDGEIEATKEPSRSAAKWWRICCIFSIVLCLALLPVPLSKIYCLPQAPGDKESRDVLSNLTFSALEAADHCGIHPWNVQLWLLESVLIHSEVLCTMKFWVWPNTCREDFHKCLARLPLGANNVPFGYLVMSSWSLPSYINLTGIPTSSYDYQLIVSEGHRMPEKFFSGEWWRGNELGGAVNNPYYWSGVEIWPMSIGMGITEQQRSAVRKFVEEAFAAPTDRGWIRAGLRQFFKERAEAGELNVMEDVSIWVHQVLMNTTLNWMVDYAYAKEFVKVQSNFFTYGTVSQVAPKSTYSTLGRFLKMPQTRDAIAAYVRAYLPIVEERWGQKLANADCSPSKSCTVQLASMLLDGLLSTGGHFLPYGIRSGLAVLFSTSSSNPGNGQGELVAGHELEFFWECLRMIPPALGIPYWRETRPTCVGMTAEETQELTEYKDSRLGTDFRVSEARQEPMDWSESEMRTNSPSRGLPASCRGYPPVNQWDGGHRYVLGILLGQQDPHVWGEGADSTFRVRPLQEYEKLSVGFNEMATNYGVNGGRSNRNCPAKELALLLGKLFFEEFDVSAWEAKEANIHIDSRGAASRVQPFTLLPRKKTVPESET
ncbi:unnamed protein product, partial [Cladocopium goreaui]